MILVDFAGNIKGDCVVTAHEEWIQCDSVSMNVNRMVTSAAGSTQRKVSNPDFSGGLTFTKTADRATPDIFMQSVCGVSLGDATVHFTQTAGQDTDDQVYQSWILHEAIITHYDQNASREGDSMESFTVNFAKITFRYDEFSGKEVKAGDDKKWDLMVNKTF